VLFAKNTFPNATLAPKTTARNMVGFAENVRDQIVDMIDNIVVTGLTRVTSSFVPSVWSKALRVVLYAGSVKNYAISAIGLFRMNSWRSVGLGKKTYVRAMESRPTVIAATNVAKLLALITPSTPLRRHGRAGTTWELRAAAGGLLGILASLDAQSKKGRLFVPHIEESV